MLKSEGKEIDFPMVRNEPTVMDFCCTLCHKPCSGTPYSFGGAFTCESCVHAYYIHPDSQLSAADIAEELRCSGRQASRLIGTKWKSSRND